MSDRPETLAERRAWVEQALLEYEPPDLTVAAINRHNLASPVEEWRPDAEGRLPLARFTALACPWNETTHGVCIGGDALECFWPRAFSRSLANGDDVAIDLDHDTGTVFSRRSRGECELWESSDGLMLQSLVPDSAEGRAALAALDSGRAKGLSVCFDRGTVKFLIAAAAYPVSCVRDCDLLGVALVTTGRPAYERTRILNFETR